MVDPPVDKGSSAFKPFIPVLDGEPHFSVANILQKYVTYGKQLGIEVVPILVTSTDVGEGVVAAVKFQKPEMLIIGTKKSHQTALGKYCTENAGCEVKIVEDDTPVPEKETMKNEAEKKKADKLEGEFHHVHKTSTTLDGTPIVIYEPKKN